MKKHRLSLRGARIESDCTYFRRQASEERTAALHATHPEARKAHLSKAERLEDLVHAIAAKEQQLKVHFAEIA